MAPFKKLIGRVKIKRVKKVSWKNKMQNIIRPWLMEENWTPFLTGRIKGSL